MEKLPKKFILPLLSASFALSVILRLSHEANASQDEAMNAHDPQEISRAESVFDITLDTQSLPEILEELQRREALILAADAEIMDRTLQLQEYEQEIEKQIQILEQAQIKLDDTLTLARDSAKEDLTHLAEIYENMRSDDAAALFSEMAPEISAGFIGVLDPEIAAKIMSGLDARQANQISIILAGRNADTPR